MQTCGCATSKSFLAKAYRDFNDEKPQTKTNVDKSEQGNIPNVQYIQVTAAQQQRP